MSDKDEAEVLLNEGIPFAQELLEKHGEFVPFGAVMDHENEITVVTTDQEDEDAALHVESLMAGFRAGACEGRFKVVAIFVNVEVNLEESDGPMDAVQIVLEHGTGYSADVFIPYAIEGDAVEFGSLIARQREGSIFPPPGEGAQA